MARGYSGTPPDGREPGGSSVRYWECLDEVTDSPNPVDQEQLKRWRLILGHHAQEHLSKTGGAGGCELTPEQLGMDEAIAAICDETGGEGKSSQRNAGLGPSAPYLAKWLGDIRGYFKEDVVTVTQNDAIEKKGLKQFLFEPEMLQSVEPNPQLVGTLMSLKGRIWSPEPSNLPSSPIAALGRAFIAFNRLA